MSGNHSHSHNHNSKNQDMGSAFAWGVGLNSIFIVTEIVFGIISGSVALIADAIHNLSDVIGLVISWIAMIIAKRSPKGSYTYGYRSATILSVLLSTAILFVAVGGIVWSAIDRIGKPAEINSLTVMAVAGIGIVINGISAWILSRGKKDLNVRSAFLHLVADAAVSAGVVVAAIIIYYTGWSILDPIISLVISGVVLWSGWGVLKDAVHLSLNAVPKSVPLAELKDYLQNIKGVSKVHDIHVWPISTTEIAMTVHLVMPSHQGDDAFLHTVCHELKNRFGIEHATIQVENGVGPECDLESDLVV